MEIQPTELLANGLWNIFTGRKKYTIKCGKCNFAYKDKVIFDMGDTARSLCPNCKIVNKWSHNNFNRYYNKMMG